MKKPMKPGYNSYAVVDCKSGRNVIVTQSARKAAALLEKGRRIEVWNDGARVQKVLASNASTMAEFIEAERRYIGERQKRHEMRNERRRL